MNFYIQQTININILRIGSISNSSVFQIGSSGIIKPASYLYNSGGFTKAAPHAKKPGTVVIPPSEGGTGSLLQSPAVPL